MKPDSSIKIIVQKNIYEGKDFKIYYIKSKLQLSSTEDPDIMGKEMIGKICSQMSIEALWW